MQKAFHVYAVIFFSFFLCGLTGAARAESIAVIDMQVINKSLASKSIQEQLEKKRAVYHAEISKQEEELKKQGKELAKQQSLVAKEVFEKKNKEFRQKAVEVQRNMQMRKTQLERAYLGAVSEVQKVVVDVVNKIATEKGLSLVVTSQQVLYNKPDVDISQEVLKRLDAQLKSVPLKIEEIKMAPAAKNTKK